MSEDKDYDSRAKTEIIKAIAWTACAIITAIFGGWFAALAAIAGLAAGVSFALCGVLGIMADGALVPGRNRLHRNGGKP